MSSYNNLNWILGAKDRLANLNSETISPSKAVQNTKKEL